MKTHFLICLCAASLLFCAVADAEIVGTKKKGLKGRYLDLEPAVNFRDYHNALIVLDPAEITSDKDRPVDTESIRKISYEVLTEKLKLLSLFGDVVEIAPLKISDDMKILRIQATLTLQYGSEAMRFWVGMGAGKSKTHIRLDIFDALTGQKLGYYNGYGTGAGSWSMSGGGAQWLAQDDLEENYQRFVELIAQKSGIAVSGG